MDEHTLFAIGSASKAFTALGVALLVDEERVTWDDRATDYLPGFELYDPWVTRELTVRDLLCHRAGLPRGDFLWYGTELGRDEILRRVRHLEPRTSFRSQFGYQNILYLAAGQMIARLEERAWDFHLWRTRYLDHPFLRHLARRLIWDFGGTSGCCNRATCCRSAPSSAPSCTCSGWPAS